MVFVRKISLPFRLLAIIWTALCLISHVTSPTSAYYQATTSIKGHISSAGQWSEERKHAATHHLTSDDDEQAEADSRHQADELSPTGEGDLHSEPHEGNGSATAAEGKNTRRSDADRSSDGEREERQRANREHNEKVPNANSEHKEDVPIQEQIESGVMPNDGTGENVENHQ